MIPFVHALLADNPLSLSVWYNVNFMKTIWPFFAALFICASFLCGNLLAAEMSENAIEVEGVSTIALGKIVGPDMKLAKFTLRNTGDAPMEITRITSTCSCLRGYPQQAAIPPHDKQVVTLELNPSKVRGEFRRSAWVHTTDPKRPRLLLTVTGNVVSLFEGLPESLAFRCDALGEAWTNTLTLTTAMSALSLGEPLVSENKTMRVEAAVTNLAQAGAFELRLVAIPLTEGMSSALVEIPIIAQNQMPNLEMRLIGKVGSQFNVAPDQLMIFPTDKPLVRGFTVRTDEKSVDFGKVTFSPQREGVTCDVRPNAKNPANFSIRVTLTPEAVEALLEEPEPKLSVGYPNYAPVDIPIVTPPAKKISR